MLNIKNLFVYFSIIFFILFSFGFYFFTKSYINFLLFNQYEQKIEILNNVLKFKLLSYINEKNINDFSKTTGADFVIFKNKQISSLKKDIDISAYKLNEIIKTNINSKNSFFKIFKHNDIKYMIIVYPKLDDINEFWFKIAIFFILNFIFILLLIYFTAKKVTKYFKNMIYFLNKINTKENDCFSNSFLKEVNLLNKLLIKTKDKILKKELKFKKQSNKISLKNTQLTSVISAISHEIKNPLSVINLSLELLKEEKEDNLKEQLFDKILKQTQKLNLLTQKLNSVFDSRLNIKKEKINLYNLCEKIISNPGFQRVILKGSDNFVLADEVLIEQVIINLLSNALKYSKENVILTSQNGIIKVKDFGIGIEQDKIKFITKKFYKIDPKNENSFGLGLFLVKRFLSIHDSYLICNSIYEQGSEFIFNLEEV